MGLQEMYKDFKTEFGHNEEERVTQAKFGAAFHEVVHEGLRTLGEEDLSRNTGVDYISKDNICK
jgi:hypothetical protein